MKTISPGSPLAGMVETTVAFGLKPGPPVIPMCTLVPAEPEAVIVPVTVPVLVTEADEPVLETEEAEAAEVDEPPSCCLRWTIWRKRHKLLHTRLPASFWAPATRPDGSIRLL